MHVMPLVSKASDHVQNPYPVPCVGRMGRSRGDDQYFFPAHGVFGELLLARILVYFLLTRGLSHRTIPGPRILRAVSLVSPFARARWIAGESPTSTSTSVTSSPATALRRTCSALPSTRAYRIPTEAANISKSGFSISTLSELPKFE